MYACACGRSHVHVCVHVCVCVCAQTTVVMSAITYATTCARKFVARCASRVGNGGLGDSVLGETANLICTW